MKKRASYFMIIVCLVFLVSCAGGKNVEEQSKAEKQPIKTDSTVQPVVEKSIVPTLFVHGYSGVEASFGNMIKRMETSELTKKELILTVTPTGEVKAQGALTGEKNNPSIQVLFEDNKSHEWNQAQWIKNCLVFIHETYGVTAVNLVGHSMGGVSSLRYLVTFGNDSSLPKVNQFVAIAAPFNNFSELSEGETLDTEIANGPVIKSQRYVDFVNGIENVSQNMNMLIIAGDLKDGSLSDGTVPVTDALSVMSLMQAHGNDVQKKIAYGKKAQHSQLHENSDVDQVVEYFLWGNKEKQ